MPLVTEQSILAGILEMEATPSKDDGLPSIPNSKSPYVAFTVDSEKTPSPIEIVHTNKSSFQSVMLNDLTITGRFPLAEYYALGKGKGRLSYHNNPIFEQPFIVRNIGDRWGVYDSFGLGDSKFGNTIESILKQGANFIDTIGGAVLGRDPSEYIGSAVGSLERTGKFLLTNKGVGFLAKQGILQRRNAQKLRTDVRYDLTKDNLKRLVNPRLYNPLSLASLPGVTKISINAYDPSLPFALYTDTIADLVSQTVIKLATTVKDTAIRVVKGVAGDIKKGIQTKLEQTDIGKFVDKKSRSVK